MPGHKPQMPEPFGADRLLALMDEAGVSHAVLVPPVLEADRNDLCLAEAEAHPDRFAVMGRLPVERLDAPQMFERMLAQKGMLGVRFTFHSESARQILKDGRADWFWPVAERLGVPVMLFAPGQVPEAGRIARAYPGLNLILDHMCLSEAMKGTDQVGETVEALLKLAVLDNVSVKVSSLPGYSVEAYPFRDLHEPVRRVVERFGRERCFWGTDFTRLRCPYRQAVTMFTEEMPFLGNDDLEWIMGRGLAKKLGWPIAG